MNSSTLAGAGQAVALFDLDGTLTWRDTLQSFLLGYSVLHPKKAFSLWRVAPAAARFAASQDRGRLKSEVIRAVMGGAKRRDVDAWSQRFVAGLAGHGTFRPAALDVLERHRRAGDRLVLLSASPDLYVPLIGKLLGFERTVCTGIKWTDASEDARLDGALTTLNRRGEEKSACLAVLRTVYPGLPFTAYGNSWSDLPHLALADAAILVNGSRRTRLAAAAAGIPTAEWR